MRAVITYWQLPEEEEEFISFLESTGKVLAIPDRWVEKRYQLDPEPLRSYIQRCDPDQLLFGLEQHLADVSIESQEHQGRVLYVGAKLTEDCVLSYRRGKLRNGLKLSQCNLAAYWQRLDKDQTTIIDCQSALKTSQDSALENQPP